jgi:polyphenol oxidase
MHTWSWQDWNGSSYLTCDLLNQWPHGFFTRQTWPQSPESLVLSISPKAKPLRVKQVHGNVVLSADAVLSFLSQQTGSEEVVWPEADGLCSTNTHQAVWACSADCTPVLIADSRTGQVAAIHAGWRGTAARIVPNAVKHLQENGSEIADLRVAMGPAIAGEVYQVSAQVAAQVGQSLFSPENPRLPEPADPEQTVAQLMGLPQPPILTDEKEGHLRLDVRRINALQLEQLGFQPEQIAVAPHCTYQDPERFFSYRRDSRKQVQWSGIVSVSA